MTVIFDDCKAWAVLGTYKGVSNISETGPID